MAIDPAATGNAVPPGGQFILETRNTLDMPVEDLAQLGSQIKEVMAANDLDSIAVAVKGNEPFGGAANPWIDILHVILPNAEAIKEDVFNGVIALCVAYMRTRFKRKHESTRPRQIRVRTPDGHPVLEISIDGPDDEAKFSTPNS